MSPATGAVVGAGSPEPEAPFVLPDDPPPKAKAQPPEPNRARPRIQLPRLDHLPDSLGALKDAVSGCTACELSKSRTQTVFSKGAGKLGLCFVGEGPGPEEDQAGLPFAGKSGELLDRMIEAMGLGPDDVYICNIVKCRPADDAKASASDVEACAPFLHRQIELLNPEVIVALGGAALEGLLGKTSGITRMRGEFQLYRGEIAVMPTFHPAYLIRTPSAKRLVWSDLKKVLRHLGRDLPG